MVIGLTAGWALQGAMLISIGEPMCFGASLRLSSQQIRWLSMSIGSPRWVDQVFTSSISLFGKWSSQFKDSRFNSVSSTLNH